VDLFMLQQGIDTTTPGGKAINWLRVSEGGRIRL
jgi:hypothetical protein